MPTINDYSFILAFRGQYHANLIRKIEYERRVGDISIEENELLKKYNKLIIKDRMLGEYELFRTPGELMRAIETHVGHSILFRPSGTHQRGKLLAYCQVMGVMNELPHVEFTSEQERVLNHTAGVCVVNAGPGTGKTTVAVRKAYDLKDDGVLILTNSSEMADELYKRLVMYPIKNDLGRNNSTKKINIISIEEYFKIKSNENEHLIIDEAHNIDNRELEYLVETFSKYTSVTIFGDSRQQWGRRTGRWYARQRNNAVNFTYCFRFQTPQMFELVNLISSRGNAHHQLVSGKGDLMEMKDSKPITYMNSDEIVSLLTDCDPSDVAVIEPSMYPIFKSKYTLNLFLTLQDNGINCYNRTYGAYKPNAVTFCTIQTCRGKEFKNIIVCGKRSHEDSNSLEFILHTRAKNQIIYHQESDVTVPNYVPEHLIQDAPDLEVRANLAIEDDAPDVDIADILDRPEWTRFRRVNNLTVTAEPCNVDMNNKSYEENLIVSKLGFSGKIDLIFEEYLVIRAPDTSEKQIMKTHILNHIWGYNKKMLLLVGDKYYEVKSDISHGRWDYALRFFYDLYTYHAFVMRRLIDREHQRLPDNTYIRGTGKIDGNKRFVLINYNDVFSTILPPSNQFDADVYEQNVDGRIITYDETLKSYARDLALKTGVFTGGDYIPALGDLYAVHGSYPLERLSRITKNDTMRGAMMLWELLMLNKLTIE